MSIQKAPVIKESNKTSYQSDNVLNREPQTPVYTVRQFSQKHPAFPEGGLRHRIFYEESNGLKKAGAIIRAGRKVLIHEAKFFAWLEAQNREVV